MQNKKSKPKEYCDACGCDPCDCGWGHYLHLKNTKKDIK